MFDFCLFFPEANGKVSGIFCIHLQGIILKEKTRYETDNEVCSKAVISNHLQLSVCQLRIWNYDAGSRFGSRVVTSYKPDRLYGSVSVCSGYTAEWRGILFDDCRDRIVFSNIMDDGCMFWRNPWTTHTF